MNESTITSALSPTNYIVYYIRPVDWDKKHADGQTDSQNDMAIIHIIVLHTMCIENVALKAFQIS